MPMMRLVGVCVVLVALTVGCGNRMSAQEILSKSLVGAGSTSANGLSNASGAPVGRSAVSGPAGAVATSAGPLAATSTGRSTSNGAAEARATTSQGVTAGDSGSAAKAPIVVGFIGTLSGFAGAVGEGIADAWVAWSKMINAQGGINGHPVHLLVADDGGDPSRAVAIAHDFVENKGAIALTLSASEVSGVGSYAQSKGVPVIGVNGGTTEWYTNPMLFMPFTYLDGASWGAARVIKDDGATKVASAYCVEASLCSHDNQTFVKYAKEVGLQVVDQQQISLTEPDYTAECLQMRNAGAQAVYVIGDSNGAVRLAQSCARQGFKPVWAIPLVTGAMANMPELQGAVSDGQTFPWFMGASSPALAQYRAAMQKYVPDRLGPDGGSTQTLGWIAAKTFEKAAADVGSKPTSQDVLNGLWSLKHEQLGGLLPGKAAITFTKGRASPNGFCVFPMKIQNGAWTAPQAMNPVCR